LPEGKPVPHADVAMLGSQAISGMTEKNGVFEYSQKLSQQVLTLEADNVELQDAKKVLDADNQLLKAKVQELQLQCEKLRDTSIYTHQDKEAAILQAREVLQSKQAEVMLARKSTEDVKQHAEALATDNMRLNGIAEKLQQELAAGNAGDIEDAEVDPLDRFMASIEAEVVHAGMLETEKRDKSEITATNGSTTGSNEADGNGPCQSGIPAPTGASAHSLQGVHGKSVHLTAEAADAEKRAAASALLAEEGKACAQRDLQNHLLGELASDESDAEQK